MKKKNIGTIPKSNRRIVESGKIPISHKYAIAHFLVCFRFLNKTWRGLSSFISPHNIFHAMIMDLNQRFIVIINILWNVCRYQSGNQKPLIKGQTRQKHEKGEKKPMIYKTPHKKVRIAQHIPHKAPSVCTWGGG